VRDYPYIWLHIDAAWLGAAFSCPELRERCRVQAINKFGDSFSVNFHKARTGSPLQSSVAERVQQWGLVSLECSGLWVRERKNLTKALDITPPFLRSTEGDSGSWRLFFLCPQVADRCLPGTVVDYRNWSLALGRKFRSAKLWFVLRSYGIEGYRAHIRRVNPCFHILSFVASYRLTTVHPPG
jgi:aromatic-L-amino-acid/L-tryptophan decarboxylase